LGLLNQKDHIQLNSTLLKDFYEPQLNLYLENVVDIKIGMKHTIFVSCMNNQKNYYASGSNSKGVLATYNNIYENTLNLTLMNLLWPFSKIDQIEVSWNNTIILTSKNCIMIR
jgi:hypothetical protein